MYSIPIAILSLKIILDALACVITVKLGLFITGFKKADAALCRFPSLIVQ